MELDLLEKVRKGREEKEAQATKVPSVVTYPDGNKGKSPMEDLSQVNVAQQLKSMMHTSQQSKQKLAHINSVLHSQVVVDAKPAPDIQVTTTVTKVCDEQATTEVKPFKKQKIQMIASQTPTIDLSDYDTEE